MDFTRMHTRSGQLDVAIETAGPSDGWPVLLLHGFPFDPHSYEAVAEELAKAGALVLAPYLRGFGPTRFISESTPRSGQQAAIGSDAVDLIEALSLRRPIVVGFDWGARAACIAAAMRPAVIGGLVAVGGYEIQDIARSAEPAPPLEESKGWYQFYFHGERGKAGLARYRRELTEQLWREWSPGRAISPDEFARAASAFDNPDFVDVVIHSYRHRFGLAAGAAVYDELELALTSLPQTTVPTIVLDPTEDPMIEPQSREAHAAKFTRLVDHLLVSSGHDMPHDAPSAVSAAVLELHALNQ